MATHARARTHTPLQCSYACLLCIYYEEITPTHLSDLYTDKVYFPPFIQTSRDVSWKIILALIKLQVSVTQSSLSSRKNLPSQTLLLKGFRKTHSSLEKLSHTHRRTPNDSLSPFPCLCTSFSIPLLRFVSLSLISVLFFPLSLSLSLPLCPLSTSLPCVSGKACLINDTRHSVRSEGWVSDK